MNAISSFYHNAADWCVEKKEKVEQFLTSETVAKATMIALCAIANATLGLVLAGSIAGAVVTVIYCPPLVIFTLPIIALASTCMLISIRITQFLLT